MEMDAVPAEAQLEALRDLVRSEGWRLFTRHMERSWGAAACEQALRESRAKCDPSEWPFESARILDTFAGMRSSFKWPEEQIKSLTAGQHAKTLTERFTGLRRAPARG